MPLWNTAAALAGHFNAKVRVVCAKLLCVSDAGGVRDAVFRKPTLTVQIAATIKLLFYSLPAS